MKLVPVERESVLAMRKNADIYGLLMEFINSNYDCVEVCGYTHKSATICMNSLYTGIKRYNLNGVSVSRRKDRVFLIRKRSDEN